MCNVTNATLCTCSNDISKHCVKIFLEEHNATVGEIPEENGKYHAKDGYFNQLVGNCLPLKSILNICSINSTSEHI